MIRSLIFLICAVLYGHTVLALDVFEPVVQGGMLKGKVQPGSLIALDGMPVKVGPEGNFVIGFARDAAKSSRLVVTDRDGLRSENIVTVKARTYTIEHVKGLPPKTVTPPPEWKERRMKETGRVQSAREFLTDHMFWQQDFLKPAEGRFSGFYGSQRILNDMPKSPHYGLDIANKVGTDVVAPAGGIVRLAASDFLLEGGIVIIDHGFGVTSTLFHLNSVDVKEGALIERGQKIGTIGSKGRANGPHVDWRLNWGQVRLDPGLVIGLDP